MPHPTPFLAKRWHRCIWLAAQSPGRCTRVRECQWAVCPASTAPTKDARQGGGPPVGCMSCLDRAHKGCSPGRRTASGLHVMPRPSPQKMLARAEDRQWAACHASTEPTKDARHGRGPPVGCISCLDRAHKRCSPRWRTASGLHVLPRQGPQRTYSTSLTPPTCWPGIRMAAPAAVLQMPGTIAGHRSRAP
eukprot:365702-Chlamydomonas_euryale.AAC.19